MNNNINLSDDPYHFDARISFGIYKNQKINTKKKKSVSLLNNTSEAKRYLGEKADEISQDNWILANVYHSNQYYIAIAPKGSVTNVMYALEPFGGAFAHTMMRFHFNKSIQLIANTPSQEMYLSNKDYELLDKPIELFDLILSVEATAPGGVQDFALLASFFWTRGLAFRMLSLTGRGIDKYTKGEANVKQYSLNLTKEQSVALFDGAIIQANNNGMSKMYQTLVANCNWFTFDMLQHSHKYISAQNSLWQNITGVIKKLLDRIFIFSKIYPPLAIFGLTWRNIRDDNVDALPNLENDPEFLRLSELCDITQKYQARKNKARKKRELNK